MKIIGLIMAAAVGVGGMLSPLLRPSNSQALAERGIALYEQRQYEDAARLFDEARAIRATPEATFGLGTALVGAGDHRGGEALLRSVAETPELAARSWYNQGNSQLTRGELAEAIESYAESLRIEPTNMAAKRNLEIALRNQQRQQSEPGDGGGEGEDAQEPAGGDSRDEADVDPEVERILRSIEQQEREELSRMRQARTGSRPLDW
jgi:tetratricopeptide (TPR) repeat protein